MGPSYAVKAEPVEDTAAAAFQQLSPLEGNESRAAQVPVAEAATDGNEQQWHSPTAAQLRSPRSAERTKETEGTHTTGQLDATIGSRSAAAQGAVVRGMRGARATRELRATSPHILPPDAVDDQEAITAEHTSHQTAPAGGVSNSQPFDAELRAATDVKCESPNATQLAGPWQQQQQQSSDGDERGAAFGSHGLNPTPSSPQVP